MKLKNLIIKVDSELEFNVTQKFLKMSGVRWVSGLSSTNYESTDAKFIVVDNSNSQRQAMSWRAHDKESNIKAYNRISFCDIEREIDALGYFFRIPENVSKKIEILNKASEDGKSITDAKNLLLSASRQHRHNDSDEFIAAYDYDETIKIVSKLLRERK